MGSDYDNITMTYSSLLQKNGKKAICVCFERITPNGKDYAEALLPNCEFINQKGFTKEEITQLGLYLKLNKDGILEKSKEISKITHWFKQ